MRWLSGLMTAVFLLAVAVQWNDPDPVVWMVGYGVAAGLSAAAWCGWLPLLPNALAALVFTFWFASLATSLPGAPSEAFTSFRMRASSHEEPREAIGLLLCAGWTAFLAWRGWRMRNGSGATAAAREGGAPDSRAGAASVPGANRTADPS